MALQLQGLAAARFRLSGPSAEIDRAQQLRSHSSAFNAIEVMFKPVPENIDFEHGLYSGVGLVLADQTQGVRMLR